MDKFSIIVSPCIVEGDDVYAKIIWDGTSLHINNLFTCRHHHQREYLKGTPAENWDRAMLERFIEIWKEWDSNDKRRFCEHQKALGWDKLGKEEVTLHTYRLSEATRYQQEQLTKRIIARLLNKESVQLTDDEAAVLKLNELLVSHATLDKDMRSKYVRTDSEIESLEWVSPDKHPDGLLDKECPICGHRYGDIGMSEEVPEDVLVWLSQLPESDSD